MSEVLLRSIGKGEMAAVRQLTLAAYQQYANIMKPGAWSGLSKALETAFEVANTAEILVAEQAGVIIGSVMLFPPALDSYNDQKTVSNIPELRLLAVAEAGRGHGVGKALVRGCIERARNSGAVALGLHTSDSMNVAIHLYESMGFVRVPEHDFQPPGAELVKAYQLILNT